MLLQGSKSFHYNEGMFIFLGNKLYTTFIVFTSQLLEIHFPFHYCLHIKCEIQMNIYWLLIVSTKPVLF